MDCSLALKKCIRYIYLLLKYHVEMSQENKNVIFILFNFCNSHFTCKSTENDIEGAVTFICKHIMAYLDFKQKATVYFFMKFAFYRVNTLVVHSVKVSSW